MQTIIYLFKNFKKNILLNEITVTLTGKRHEENYHNICELSFLKLLREKGVSLEA